jgi:hypothetical protein
MIAAAGVVLAVPATAQSAKDVLETAMERHEQRLAGIDNITVVQEVMGFEMTSYFEKQMVDGHPTLMMKDTGDGSMEDVGIDYAAFKDIADHATLTGIETVDGQSCYALRVDDLSTLDWNPSVGENDSDFTAKTGTFYIDRDEYLLRKMEIEGEAQRDGRVVPVNMQMLVTDYREVDGWIHPFVTEMTVSGFAGGLSEEDKEEAREALEEMREQMKDMSASERAMMEKMMAGQIERLEEMLESGEMNVTVQVKELRVNAGPSK